MLIKQLIWSQPPLRRSMRIKINTWKRCKQRKTEPVSTSPIIDSLKCESHKAQEKTKKNQNHIVRGDIWIETGERRTIKNIAVPLSFWRMPFPWEESPILPGVVVQFAANPADLPLLEGHPAMRRDFTLEDPSLTKIATLLQNMRANTGYDESIQIPAVHKHQLWVKALNTVQEHINTVFKCRYLAFLLQILEMIVGTFIGYKCYVTYIWTFPSLSSNKAVIQ